MICPDIVFKNLVNNKIVLFYPSLSFKTSIIFFIFLHLFYKLGYYSNFYVIYFSIIITVIKFKHSIY